MKTTSSLIYVSNGFVKDTFIIRIGSAMLNMEIAELIGLSIKDYNDELILKYNAEPNEYCYHFKKRGDAWKAIRNFIEPHYVMAKLAI